MNKELLLKYHFWLLLVAFAALALTLPLVIYAAVGSEIAEEKKKLEEAEAKAQQQKPKGKDYEFALKQLKDRLKEKATKDWRESWEEQKALFSWPAEMGREQSVANLKFGDDLSKDIIDQYTTRFYEQPYTDAVKQVLPTKFNGDWKSVLRYVPRWGEPKKPTAEEVWLALEDFWVQTELLRTIGVANQTATRFEAPSRPFSTENKEGKPYEPKRVETEAEVTTEKGVKQTVRRLVSVTQTFRIGTAKEDVWVLELTATARGEKTAVSGTLKNESKVPQSIGTDTREYLRFWTDREELDRWQKTRGPRKEYDVRIPLQTGDIPPGGKYDIKEVVVNAPLKGRYAGLFDAAIEEEGRKPDPAKGEKFVRKLRSRIWELELVSGLKPGEGNRTTLFRGTLTNISGMKQPLGPDSRMGLLVWTRRPQWEAWQETRAAEHMTSVRVPVESEAVPAGGKVEIREFPFVGDLTAGDSGLYGVEQVLNAITVPVKRIDVVAMGYRSNRFANMALRMNLLDRPAFKEAAPKEGEGGMPSPGGPGGPGMPPPGMPGMPPPGMPGMPGMPGSMRPGGPGGPGEGPGVPGQNQPGVAASGVGQSKPTPTGLERARYTDVTAQVRRMPVALTLIVEQAAIQDVQTAFANSKLRYQETQLHWIRTRENVVGDASEAGPGEGPARPPMPGMPGSPGYNPYVAKTGAGGRFELPGGGSPTESGADTVLPPTLVELTIYGIASLYERFPEKTAEEKKADGK